MRYLLFVLALMVSFSAHATETILTIRVKAKDAKFVGSSIGGARVLVRIADTGEILANGLTLGSTGNTEIIMKSPIQRGQRITDDNTARFEARIDIERPTFVTVEVLSPVNQRQAAVAASTQLWLIPGKDIRGDGLVIEVPGFVVNVLRPRTHNVMSTKSLSPDGLPIEANVVMMCGCPIQDGGLWDAKKMEVSALVYRDGKSAGTVPMSCTETNLFKGALKVDGPGLYEITVYAYNPETGNTGVDRVNFLISE